MTQEGLQKDPQQWKSGDDPITPAQQSYLETLANQAGEDVPEGLTKAAASEKIDELRAKAGLEEDTAATGAESSDSNDGEPAQGGEYRNTPISPNANR